MTEYKAETVTYGVGRFVIDIPAEMKFSGNYSMRTFDIKEVVWPESGWMDQTIATWRHLLDQIQQTDPPKGKTASLIEEKEFSGIGKFCRAAFSYKEHGRPTRGYIDLLASSETKGLWITSFGKSTGKEFMCEKATDLARAYHPPAEHEGRVAVLPGRDSFYLRYGAIDLPFEYDESVRLSFKGHPLDSSLTLRVMTIVVNEDESIGLLERAADAINKKLAPDLKLEKIRGRRLTVAGLRGEEMVERATDVDGTKEVSFTWMCLGKKDAAHHPRIILEMVSDENNLEEKLALWSAVMASMRPAGR